MEDPKVKNYLVRAQFRYELKIQVSFADIDWKASRENKARLTTALDEERVNKYNLEMIDGVEFPPIVLLNLPPEAKFKWIIATGVHRCAAAMKAGKTGFDAYCVYEANDYRREVLFRTLNTLEGNGVTISEQMQSAIDLHLKFSDISLRQIAKEWSLNEHTLNTAFQEYKARQRGIDHGWDFRKMKTPQKAYVTLWRIPSDITYKAAVECALYNGLTPAVVVEMVKCIKKTKSEAEAAEVIKQYQDEAIQAKEKSKARHGRIPAAPATKMLSDAKKFIKHLDKGINSLYLDSLPNPKQARDLLEQVGEAAKLLIAALARMETMRHAAK